MRRDAPTDGSSPEPRHEPSIDVDGDGSGDGSGSLWRQVLDSLPTGVVVTNRTGDILLGNAASSRIWGGMIRASNERYPKSLGFVHGTREPIPPDGWGSVRALTRGETSVNELIDIKTFDGREKTIQNSAAPIRDDAGAIIGAVVINEDVTERVRGEEALRKSEWMLREAEALGHTGSWEWDLVTGEICATEENLRVFFGDALKEKPALEDYVALYHPDDRERMLGVVEGVPSDGEDLIESEYRIVRPDRSVRWIRGRRRTVRDADGRAVRAHGTNTDITERRVAEHEVARRSRQQAAIARLSLLALSTDSMQVVFDEATALVAATLGVEIAVVMEALADEGTLLVRASTGPIEEGTVTSANAPTCMGWCSMRATAPVTVEDLPAETRFAPCELLLSLGVKSGVTMQIPGKTAPFGVLAAHTAAAKRFADDEVSFVSSIAHVLATSIDQKRTAHELDEKRERLQALSRRLLDAQEAERRAVARELHDDFGAMLTAIKLNLQRKNWSAPEARLETLELVDQAIKQVRELALDLRPSILDDLGLAEALRWYATREMQRAGLSLELDLQDVDGRLPVRVATACFRLVQEALTNVVRHSGARAVRIALRDSEESVSVEVRDDGKGFDVGAALRAASSGKSQGLLSMQERAELSGGRLSIDSSPGEGTTVRASLGLSPGGSR